MTPEFNKGDCDERMTALMRYLETRIEAERKIIEERFRGQSHALDLQAKEYTRRLGELNSAHERADRLAERIIGRDLYEQDRVRNAADHEAFKHDLTVIQTRSLTFASAWGIAAVLASLGLSLLFHFL